jgi:hypothetical protein
MPKISNEKTKHNLNENVISKNLKMKDSNEKKKSIVVVAATTTDTFNLSKIYNPFSLRLVLISF